MEMSLQADQRKSPKAFLLAAGLGTRLKPLTDKIPKCLIPFAGRPLLDYWLESLASISCAEARVNTHAHAEKTRIFLQSKFPSRYPRVTESHEPKLLGSAGAIAANPTFADDASEVVIICADQLSAVDLRAMVEFHRQHGDPLTMLAYHVTNPTECGIVELDDVGRVIEFIEKPAHPKSNLANGGIYIVSPAAYREIVELDKFDFGFDVLPRFVGRMRAWTWNGLHRDIGTHAAIRNAELELPRVKESLAARLEPCPAVFFDRDGTLIESIHYLTLPEQVRLVPDAASTLRRLRSAGFRCVIATNQSAIGRGFLTEDGLTKVHDELISQLVAEEVWVDGIYHCSFAPGEGPDDLKEHTHRKPNPGMLLQAAQELNLDLGRSWMIGDMVSDVDAGRNAGCRGSILLGKSTAAFPNAESSDAISNGVYCLPSLTASADLILSTVSEG